MDALILATTNLVPTAGVEPAQPKPPPPQGGVSTSFTTSALFYVSLDS